MAKERKLKPPAYYRNWAIIYFGMAVLNVFWHYTFFVFAFLLLTAVEIIAWSEAKKREDKDKRAGKDDVR